MSSPALGSNMPTQAERGREADRLVDEALTKAAKNLAWAKRHSDDRGVTDVLVRMAPILQSTDVWVLTYERCECDDDTLIFEQWFVSEAERDAALDAVVANTGPGERVTWFTLGLPKRLGDLTDDSVSMWVAETGPGASSAHEVHSKRYGTCPDCGRSEHPPSADEALDRLAQMVLDGDDGKGALVELLHETGRLREYVNRDGRWEWHDDPSELDEDDKFVDADHEAWVLSVLGGDAD